MSFEVNQGEVVGIIGRNGAGKSTLLKILSRITEPTSGRAEIYGRVGSLLEVGTGFHQELTGRENIYLNGAILGMRKAEIDRKLDEIVAFAEVDQFIDTPVKRYSSGMYVRLAFAVAAHLEPEILIVDEVLAVGDAAFQRKCLGKMGDVAGEGRTVLFVSHNMAAITRLCRLGHLAGPRAAQGRRPRRRGRRPLLCGRRRQALGELTFRDRLAEAPGSEFIRLLAVRTRSSEGHVTTSIDARSAVSVEVEYEVLRPAASLRVGFSLTAHDGTVLFSSTDADTLEEARTPGTFLSRVHDPGELPQLRAVLSVGRLRHPDDPDALLRRSGPLVHHRTDGGNRRAHLRWAPGPIAAGPAVDHAEAGIVMGTVVDEQRGGEDG